MRLSSLSKTVMAVSWGAPLASARPAICAATSQFGFRNLIFPQCPSFKISASNLSTASNAVLPRLPVPALDATLNKYLKTIKPFLNNQEYVTSKNVVKEFGEPGGIGQKLQELLLKHAEGKENWLADWWLHSSYLDFRWPVVVYSSPGHVWPFAKFNSKKDQLHYAAKVILGALDYKDIIDNDKFPQDKMGKDLLDMSQYKKVLGTCRIPGVKRDSLSFNNSDHVIVIHNGHFFSLPVIGNDGVRLNEEQIVDKLQEIVSASQQTNESPVGILTSEHRDTWGKVYDIMLNDNGNKSSLKEIEKSIFVMSLDKASGLLGKTHSEKQTIAGNQTIHGGGSKSNAGNRWFDKTVQFIVGEDGVNGLTYEHSPAEGQPVAILVDHVVDYINGNKSAGKTVSASPKNISQLNFNISPIVKEAIETAKVNMDKLVSDLDLNCFTFSMFGKEFIKSQKLSPDSFIQMAIQFAFYRVHRVPGAHYESAATRKYTGGRTETIRSCSEESVEFAETMLKPHATIQQKARALQTAIKAHKDYSVQAVNGYGVDRHFLGLKLIAIENGIPLPKIYSDQGFVKSAHMRMSTSQVASKCDGFMCFGPLVSDGYATCYNPRPYDINFGTSAFNANVETSAKKYREALEKSLEEMHNVLMQATQSKL